MISVLIVGDHERFRRLARRLLEAEGLDVVGVAHDAAAAGAAVAWLRPDVVLLDVLLAGTDGFAVAERLRAHDPRLGIVLTSSRDPAAFGAMLPAAPVAGFVHKDGLSAAALARVTG